MVLSVVCISQGSSGKRNEWEIRYGYRYIDVYIDAYREREMHIHSVYIDVNTDAYMNICIYKNMCVYIYT